jgi:ABC-2 type transport system permease protein
MLISAARKASRSADAPPISLIRSCALGELSISATLLTSVALAVFGWVPRLAGAVWGVLLAFVALGEFGVLWNAPGWLMDLSPFRHSPLLPVGTDAVPAMVALTAVAAGLAVLGYLGWRRRDLAA